MRNCMWSLSRGGVPSARRHSVALILLSVMQRFGEIRGRSYASQRYRASGLNLVALLADGLRSGRVSLFFWLRTHLTEICQAAT
jgi:hypothetical protein